MKNVIFLVLSVILVSCSKFLDTDPFGKTLTALSIAGGGLLSSDTANDITPFLFRDPKNGGAYLFFASARSGNLDLYYAVMNTDGTFGQAMAMDTSINSSLPEYSPIVYRNYMTMPAGTNLIISFIRVSNSQTNILSFNLNDDLSTTNFRLAWNNTNVCRLSLFNPTNMNPQMVFSYKSTNWLQLGWDSMYGFWYSGVSYQLRQSNWVFLSVCGYQISNGANWTNHYLLNTTNTSLGMFYYGRITSSGSTNIVRMSAYDSKYSDVDSFVDCVTMKVYFASDRAGKGNFDLYRYNKTLFDDQNP